MSDLGGSHPWLVDVGGGTPRSMRPGDAGVHRPTDEQIGRDIAARTPLGHSVERLTFHDDATAVLKWGGFIHGQAEHVLYTQVLEPDVDGSPALLARGDGWLLLEDLGSRSPRLDDPHDVAAVYARLARLHAFHTGQSLPADLVGSPLTLTTPADAERTMERLTGFVEQGARDPDVWELGPAALRTLEHLRAWSGAAASRLLSSGPCTLLHGDYQRGNWLMGPGGARVIDWELAATGPGVLDLYYLSPESAAAGHVPAAAFLEFAREAYGRSVGPFLADAIAWAAVAWAVARLAAYFGHSATRASRGDLPGAAAALLSMAVRYAR